MTLVVGTALVVLIVVIWQLVPGGPRHVPRADESGSSIARLVDDFSSRSGWAMFAGGRAGLGYSEGGYRLRLDRPMDDGLSVLVLRGERWPSVAATAAVEERAPIGGLVGVGCAAGKDGAYVGAVDPATSGFVILRAIGSSMALLRYGAGDDGIIRPVPEENELQLQCSIRTGQEPGTSIRLFVNRRFLAAYQDSLGLGPFNGMVLGGVSLRTPLDAMFKRAVMQTTPPGPGSPVAIACDRLVAASSLEDDYGWLADSGGTKLNSMDFDTREVLRLGRELDQVSAGLKADARGSRAGGKARRSLRYLADRLRVQGDALDSLTSAIDRGPVDTTVPSRALSCSAPRFVAPPSRGSGRPTRVPRGASASQRMGTARELDERLRRDLPAPVFLPDAQTLPARPGLHVDVNLSYRSFRVFGNSIEELKHSLRINAIHVEGELAAGVTDSRFEWAYQTLDGARGCALVPGVTLNLVVTLPRWKPPAGADRYLRNQWNQFMWDLDDHERHHSELWIRAANRMIATVEDEPPDPSCTRAVAAAKARIARVFREYERLQRAFDRDVAAGRVPGPSLP